MKVKLKVKVERQVEKTRKDKRMEKGGKLKARKEKGLALNKLDVKNQ